MHVPWEAEILSSRLGGSWLADRRGGNALQRLIIAREGERNGAGLGGQAGTRKKESPAAVRMLGQGVAGQRIGLLGVPLRPMVGSSAAYPRRRWRITTGSQPNQTIPKADAPHSRTVSRVTTEVKCPVQKQQMTSQSGRHLTRGYRRVVCFRYS
ncbi:hypothetical protein BDY21DRAFT_351334 [Lineolata rhizophorae]|uniref:Uncharacterized protein n=1 Tax=Lineolata rhizophorae TaxID=578093 RepID=A0A6A6NV45_9PEZI|nr:hypothetical protein BDY21DRAFT_351334 [Lineolata rhizophorae]